MTTALALALVLAGSAPQDALRKAERLIDDRETPGSLEQAIAVLSDQEPGLATLLALAKAHALLVDTLDPAKPGERRDHEKHREAGKTAAQRAVAIDPQSGPAHYWLGLLLLFCSDGEQSYSLLKRAVQELETADRLSPDVDEAGPARMLGRVYQLTPGWPFLGSTAKSIEYLERARKSAPDNLKNRLWLGLSYEAAGRKRRAKEQLSSVIDAPPRPGREHEDAALKHEAADHLRALGR